MPHLDSERNTPHHSPGLKMMRVTQAEKIEQAASVSIIFLISIEEQAKVDKNKLFAIFKLRTFKSGKQPIL